MLPAIDCPPCSFYLLFKIIVENWNQNHAYLSICTAFTISGTVDVLGFYTNVQVLQQVFHIYIYVSSKENTQYCIHTRDSGEMKEILTRFEEHLVQQRWNFNATLKELQFQKTIPNENGYCISQKHFKTYTRHFPFISFHYLLLPFTVPY